jgi:adenylate cyclase
MPAARDHDASALNSTALPQADAASSLNSRNPLVQWLWEQGWIIASLSDLVRGLGHAMNGANIPLMRLRLTVRTLHPQLAGLSHNWWRDDDVVEEFWPPLSILQEEAFLKSPYALLYQGAGAVRRRLDVPGATLDFPILEELQAQGATDYVALPLIFADGRINAMTIATDRRGGFTTPQLQTVAEMMPMLARLMEVHALRRTAETVLETYLGRLTGERVLNGLIHRGEGEDIHAVIWLCDLRDSTLLADRLPRSAFLELLNDYFERMAGAVMANDGEVLKFIGDAMLAIFPIGAISEHPERCPHHIRACSAAVAAAREAMHRMADLNRGRSERRDELLRFGIALHLGDVTYGNVGAPNRLDFTVIGPAVNETARLEAMCKMLSQPLVISADFARVLPEPIVSLGVHALDGVRRAHELFTLRGLG